MRINKIKEVKVYATDDRELNFGDKVIFTTNEKKCYAGVFHGINKRGALEFTSILGLDFFGVMPNSIVEIYKADIDLVIDLPFKAGAEDETD